MGGTFHEQKRRGMQMRQRGQGWFFFRAFLMSLALLSVTQSVRADMSMTEANKAYSVRFREWVYVYMNMEFLQAAPAALDYWIEMTEKVVDNKVKFVITGYYFDTKRGLDWYRSYASQLDSKIALLCHTWTRQGYPITPDDFEIKISKEKAGRSH
jgi:hypothetical protein